MIFDRNENKPVIALPGSGSIGTAITRRIAAGKKILLGDISEKHPETVSHDLRYSDYDVETCVVNALEKESVAAFSQKVSYMCADTCKKKRRERNFFCSLRFFTENQKRF